ncbi:MAG: RHS repeat-associated core domain-containing protein [Myxococcales bacterium]|nr:MAG: RHS repeat-associated core domain-containing protein [Myxococcales bacterium]
MEWDYADRLKHTLKSVGSRQDTHFTYDAAGQRVRKVYVHNGLIEERIYLGGYEVYRRHTAGSVTAAPEEERQTLHVMDDQRRVAMVETKTRDAGAVVGGATSRWRFQLDNHLGSACLELDASGEVISYEEYHPYGGTAFHTASGGAEVSAKRYRYTGKEKDDETGLYYHGARYYAPWLGRWSAADPAGIADGLNLYRYSRDNPIRYVDPSGTESSTLDRALGGLKAVGGALETLAGAALVLGGAATSEFGVGVPILAAGVFVTAHGADTTVSGIRTAISGEQVDTLTSQGLQAAGMSRRAANLTDAGISVVGTLGAGAATRAPAAAAGEVSVAFRAGAPVGHNMVGVSTAAEGTQWSHLVVRGAETTSGVVTSGEAVVVASRTGPGAAYLTATVPVTAAKAEAALASSQAQVATSSVGAYSYLSNNCTTYASGVLAEAGIVSLPGSTPSILLATTALQSPAIVQPLAAAGAGVNASVGAISLASTEPSTPIAKLMSVSPPATVGGESLVSSDDGTCGSASSSSDSSCTEPAEYESLQSLPPPYR